MFSNNTSPESESESRVSASGDDLPKKGAKPLALLGNKMLVILNYPFKMFCPSPLTHIGCLSVITFIYFYMYFMFDSRSYYNI